MVSLTFDDGLASHLLAARTLADQGLAGTFYVCSGLVGTPGHLAWSDLAELARAGHEVGGHTVDHVELTTVDPGEARRQITVDRKALVAQGFAARSFAYPFGARDDTLRRLVCDAGYATGRRAWGLRREGADGAYGVDFPPAESLPPRDRWATRTIDSIERTTPLAEVQRAVTRAEEHGGGWVTLVFHGFGDEDRYSVAPALLRELAAWLARRRTLVRPVHEVVAAPR